MPSSAKIDEGKDNEEKEETEATTGPPLSTSTRRHNPEWEEKRAIFSSPNPSTHSSPRRAYNEAPTTIDGGATSSRQNAWDDKRALFTREEPEENHNESTPPARDEGPIVAAQGVSERRAWDGKRALFHETQASQQTQECKSSLEYMFEKKVEANKKKQVSASKRKDDQVVPNEMLKRRVGDDDEENPTNPSSVETRDVPRDCPLPVVHRREIRPGAVAVAGILGSASDASMNTDTDDEIPSGPTDNPTYVVQALDDEAHQQELLQQVYGNVVQGQVLNDDDNNNNNDAENGRSNKKRWQIFGGFFLLLALIGGAVVAWIVRDGTRAASASEPSDLASRDPPDAPIHEQGTSVAPTAAPTVFNFVPDNDQCSNATIVELNQAALVGTTQGASFKELVSPCFGSLPPTGYGVWYTVVGTGNPVRVSTCESDNLLPEDSSIENQTMSKTTLSVYRGNCNREQNLECIAANDNYCGGHSSITWLSDRGVAYKILVQGPMQGRFKLAASAAGEHGECEAAIGPLPTDGTEFNITFANATETMVPSSSGLLFPCSGYSPPFPLAGIYFSVVGTGKALRVETTAKTYAVYRFVWQGSCDALICPTSYVRQDYDYASNRELREWISEEGQIYHVMLRYQDYDGDEEGGVVISVAEFDTPANNHCENAVGPLPTDGSTVYGSLANTTVDRLGSCVYSSLNAPSLWYSIIGTGKVFHIVVAAPGAVFENENFWDVVFQGLTVGILKGPCNETECYDIGFRPGGNYIDMRFSTEEGADYFVVVTKRSDAIESFELSVDEEDPQVPNDDCASAMDIFPDPNTTILAFNENATTDDGCIRDDGSPLRWARGMWYTFVGTGNIFRVSTCHSATTFEPQTIIFQGNCANLTCLETIVSRNDHCASDQEIHSWLSVAGERYYVLVASWDTGAGSLGLSVEEFEPVENDDCSAAFGPIVANGTTIEGSTSNALEDAAMGECLGSLWWGPGVWYTTVGTGSRIFASTCRASGADTNILVYEEGCGNLTCFLSENGKEIETCANSVGQMVSWPTEEGRVYHLLVYSEDNFGDFELTIAPPAINNECRNAIGPVPPDGALVAGSTYFSTQMFDMDIYDMCGDVTWIIADFFSGGKYEILGVLFLVFTL